MLLIFSCLLVVITPLLICSAYMMFPVIEKFFDYFFNIIIFISLEPSTCPIDSVQIMNTEKKTGNDVSKFMHSNWTMPSYYSSLNTRVCFTDI